MSLSKDPEASLSEQLKFPCRAWEITAHWLAGGSAGSCDACWSPTYRGGVAAQELNQQLDAEVQLPLKSTLRYCFKGMTVAISSDPNLV